MVYRFFTGTPFSFTKLEFNPEAFGGVSATDPVLIPGPMHTRTDINLEKTWGNPGNVNVILGIEIFNFFNQKDPRSVPNRQNDQINLNPSLWQQWGIDKPEGVVINTVASEDVFDVTSYWDSPREMKFSVRVKW